MQISTNNYLSTEYNTLTSLYPFDGDNNLIAHADLDVLKRFKYTDDLYEELGASIFEQILLRADIAVFEYFREVMPKLFTNLTPDLIIHGQKLHTVVRQSGNAAFIKAFCKAVNLELPITE
jgi:hypothetical protein